MRYFVSLAGRTVSVELREDPVGAPGRYLVTLGDQTHHVQVEQNHLLVDGQVLPCSLDPGLGRAHFRHDSAACTVSTVDPKTAGAANIAQRPELRAPMPGKVVAVSVAEGDLVQAGQCVVVVEAMKMQNELTAPLTAHVTRVHAEPGRAVEAGALLLEFEAKEPSAGLNDEA